MMTTEVLEKHLKKTTIVSNVVSLVIALLTATSIAYGFYFNTNSTLEMHSRDIKDIKQDIGVIKQDMTNTAVFKGMTEAEQKAIQDRVTRIEDKQDKILEVLGTINRNTSK